MWYEDGERQQRESVSEEKLSAELEKVKERLEADAPNMKLPGADLIAHYLDPDRLPVQEQWSRKHAHTQRRLCERFAAPVIDTITCQDIKTDQMQKIVNAAPTPGEGDRVPGMISAVVSAGLEGGYLAKTWRGLAMGICAQDNRNPSVVRPFPAPISRCGSAALATSEPDTRCGSAQRAPTIRLILSVRRRLRW